MPPFRCSFCIFSAPYDYFGRNPPFCKGLILLEDAFVMKDPFSACTGHLVIGSKCSMCKKLVCVNQECSLFYSQRFCMQCAIKCVEEFPSEIKQEIKKRSTKDKS